MKTLKDMFAKINASFGPVGMVEVAVISRHEQTSVADGLADVGVVPVFSEQATPFKDEPVVRVLVDPEDADVSRQVLAGAA